MSATAKTYDFPVGVRWLAGKRTVVSVRGKDDLEVATPPEFKGGVEGVWSPEDLFVGSVASCFTVTLVGIADRRGIPLCSLAVGGSGRVTQRRDGRFGFAEIVLHVELATDPDFEQEAADAARAAELGCLVACSVDLPVRVELTIRTAPHLELAL
jgi:organic hydroperoxide reductase OsmC/OhrA